MLGWLLIKEKKLILRFVMTDSGVVEKTDYPLGGAITDFAAINPQISEKLFQILRKKFVTDVSNRIDMPTMGAYVPFLRKALETNPYLFIYLKFYAECLIQSCANKEKLSDNLKSFLSKEIFEKYFKSLVLLTDAKETSNFLGKIISEDMEYRREHTKKYIEDIFSNDTPLEKYTIPQRFFILKNESESSINRTFKMNITSEYDFERTANLGTVKAALIDNPGGILAEYEIQNPDDIISLELFYVIKNNLPVKLCRYCGEYFVPSGRSDSEYCNRISVGETKRCVQIGAMHTFKEKHSDNPIYTQYNKAYKKYHSKLRKGKLYEEEFKNWSALARKARDDFISQNKTVEEYLLKLEELDIKE